jgi:hypothetical protein
MQLLTGIIVMGFAVGGLFFLRFWRQTRDRLFMLFGVAFFLLAIQQLRLGVEELTTESLPLLFTIRLLAFCVIIAAIADKNLHSKRR